MAKKTKNKNDESSAEEEYLPFSKISEKTKRLILSIVLYALALFFILAAFNLAGVVGKTGYTYLALLAGKAYFLLPLVSFLIAFSLHRTERPHIWLTNFGGGLLVFLGGIGMLEVGFKNEFGGKIGYWFTYPFVQLFDVYLSFVFLAALFIIGLLVMFDGNIPFANREFWKKILFRKKDGGVPSEPAVVPETNAEEVAMKKNEETSAKAKETKAAGKPKAAEEEMDFYNTVANAHYSPPPLEILEGDRGRPGAGDIKANANIIKRTFANFGINVEMDEITIGPTITRYALKPAEGVKLARIVALQNDLSLALAAHPLRIEAPIPGKSLVGIEVPNTTKALVGLGSLIAAKEFQESPHPLFFVLGRGTAGTSHFANLAKSPHLLVAGATGSGKSVSIHTIITSFLYRNSPERMRLILIDPKRVELTLYNHIPHLLTPVITDAKKAILALKWAAKEMDRRYNILEARTVRDIQSYHKNISLEEQAGEPMPYIVIIIDELADMMTLFPREFEATIVRLAQMSRAVGIHLILSTQRPSVEIITGLIKANIPSRVAFQVPSQIDSRTILDMPGAEKLLGAGDMLYLGGEMSKPQRIQAAYISEQEVKKVAKYLVDNYENAMTDEISFTRDENNSNAIFSASLEDEGGSDDELYEEAREIVIQSGKASSSYLQRRLKVGYARAARLLDMLEERGVVGPGEGAKPRDVLIPRSEGVAAAETPTSEQTYVAQ
jgi:S-DNA-T family DNA segregation ATPase FtsK/SpoIIIE